jgi:hypothetical protein
MFSKLKRNHTASGYGDPGAYSLNILVKDLDKKINPNDKIDDITYGPNISREWDFERPVDNSEWSLQSGFTKKL